MTRFVIYQTGEIAENTHKILRTGSCPDSMVAMQAKKGESVMTVPVGTVVDDVNYEVYSGSIRAK